MTLSSRQIIDRAILNAIVDGNGVGLRRARSSAHPRQYLVVQDGRQMSLWLYCWTLTPGGRPSLPDEYRIQMTSVQSPLPVNPDGYTLILGYEPTRGVFAGYDLGRHRNFTSGSPSVQVRLGTLNNALQTGLAFEEKANGDIVIGVRSDLLLFYTLYADELHRLGEDVDCLEMVRRASDATEFAYEDLSHLTQERQMVVQETSRWSRSTRFKRQVLNAYENRCAVTRQQLKLVDAAHILPVKAGTRSIDDVRNGISLSPTYHRAFDNGLIYLDENIVMRLNTNAANELHSQQIAGGIEAFASTLGKVHLPFDPRQHPDPYFIQLANEFRELK